MTAARDIGKFHRIEALKQSRALGFALNALVLWNGQYMNDAIDHLTAGGHHIPEDDLRRLSPLAHEHIKLLGDFPFNLLHQLGDRQRRPLRQLGNPA